VAIYEHHSYWPGRSFGKKLHRLKVVFFNFQILERGFVPRSNMAILDHQSLNPGLSVDLDPSKRNQRNLGFKA